MQIKKSPKKIKCVGLLNSLENKNDQDILFGRHTAGALEEIRDSRMLLITLKMTINNEIGKAKLALMSNANES